MVKEEQSWVQSKPVGSDSYSAEMQMQEMGVVADKWKGTDTDQHDMRVLGRTQVLRVSPLAFTDGERSLILNAAQFWLLINSRFCDCTYLHMGDSICVSLESIPEV